MLHTLEERRRNFDRSLSALLSNPEIVEEFLYYYQSDAIRGIHSVTQRDKTRSYVQMPTSSGKTEVMLSIIEQLCQSAPIGDLPRMFIVEPTQKLVIDTRRRLLKHFPNVPVGLYYSDEHTLGQALTIITGDSFNHLLDTGVIKPKEVDYLFIDEAHRWLTDLRRDALKPFYETSIITGFTATPRFNKLKALYRTLGEKAYSIDYAELIAEGYIGERANIIVGMNLPKEAGSKAERKAYGYAVRDVILNYRDELENDENIAGHKTIIFNWEISDAKDTADLLNNDPRIREKLVAASGNPNIIPAAVIHGGLSGKRQDELIKDFDDGKIGYLVGAKIPLEGLDTKARVIFTPERWSEVEMEQAGGRVRDRSALNRIFTILRENSGNRRPVFYADCIGAARITKDGVQYGLSSPIGQLKLSHPSIGNLNIYNTPHEVATYIGSRESELQNKTVSYLGVHRMAEVAGAWQPEVAYIYKLLSAQLQKLPEGEKFCRIAGIDIPREFLKVTGNDGIVIREEAAEIIRDMIGNHLGKPDNTITYSDIASDVMPARDSAKFREIITDTKHIFSNLEKSYATAFLPWKYGTEAQAAHTTALPADLRIGVMKIPFHYVGIYEEGNGASLGVRESALGRYWAQRIVIPGVERTPSTAEWVRHIDEEFTGDKSNYFWELIKHASQRREGRFNDGNFLTETQIVRWIEATREKTGEFPIRRSETVWHKKPDGTFEIVKGEGWQAINQALADGLRGLVNGGGRGIAASLADLKRQHGLIEVRELSEKKIVEWLQATKEKTGRLPSLKDEMVWCKTSDEVFEVVEDDTWASIDYALRNKTRGLTNADGSAVAESLLALKKKHNLFEIQILTETQILEWIKATKKKTGDLPNSASRVVWSETQAGNFQEIEGLTWQNIDYALRHRGRGLRNPDGACIAESLADLKRKHGYDRQLTEEQIAGWVQATYEKTGKYPAQGTEVVWRKNTNGEFEVVEGEIWRAIDLALRGNLRGLGRSIKNPNNATSLAELKKKFGLFENRDLTDKQIVEWIKATVEKTGKLPAKSMDPVWCKKPDGTFEIVENENWGTIDHALQHKKRGLVQEDGSAIADSLSHFKSKYGFAEDRSLTEEKIVDWIKATFEKTGKYPSTIDTTVWYKKSDGNFEIVDGETWGAISAAILQKGRGLVKEDGSPIAKSFADLKSKHGFVRSTLTESQIVEWMKATFEKTGELPKKRDKVIWTRNSAGDFEVVKGESWSGIDAALTGKLRGLNGENEIPIAASLTTLREKHWSEKENKPALTESQILEWLIATKEKTGRVPSLGTELVWHHDADKGPIVVEGETWGGIHHALRFKLRGLVNADGSGIATSLESFEKKHGFINSGRTLTRDILTKENLIDWIKATREKDGKYPTKDRDVVWRKTSDGNFEVVENETWGGIHQCLGKGFRGLVNEDGTLLATSLPDFRNKYGLSDAPVGKKLYKEILTRELIIKWLADTKKKTGNYPYKRTDTIWSQKSDGSFETIENETWCGIDQALKGRKRGLINQDGSKIADSLSDFKKKYGCHDDKDSLEAQAKSAATELLNIATHELESIPSPNRSRKNSNKRRQKESSAELR